ncbi:MAG: chordopoxvirus fusion protein [Thermodesulfovibrio sp.]
MLFSTEIIEEIEKLDPDLRTVFIKILKSIEKVVGDVVKKRDFDILTANIKELSENVNKLSININILAETQKRTGERVNELTEAQGRTEERVSRLETALAELAEAQRKTEETVGHLDRALAELAEALSKLTQEHAKTREQLGGLSHTVGYILENEAYKALPKLLFEDFGLHITGKLKRGFIELGKQRWEEINIIGEAIKDGKAMTLLGEAKTQLKKKDIDNFLAKIDKIKNYFSSPLFLVLVTHQVANPTVVKYAQEKGINRVYFSYEF